MPGEESASDRTEDATPRKRQQEREKGRVAKSRDLGAAAILLAAAVLLKVIGGMVANTMTRFAEGIFGWGGEMADLTMPTKQEILPHVLRWLLNVFLAGAPLLGGILLVAAAANYLQVGAMVATKALTPDINKLNPVSGFQRMFSLRGFMTLAMNLAKITLLVAVAWPTVAAEIARAPNLMDGDTQGLFVHLVDTVLWLAIKLAAVLLLLGVADYAYQRHQMSQDMKMTKQQVKEEYKDSEGSPEIKQKRRQLHRQMAQQRMMQEVPSADVVIRNPTHYAVALKYDPTGDFPAPMVVAKGKNREALRIIDIALEHKVPVVTDPPMARQLYAMLEVGQVIPEELYEPVAAILGEIMRHSDRGGDYQERFGLADGREAAAF